MPRKTIDQQLAELDAWLASGGFSRAKNPKGALKRARTQRTTDLQQSRVAAAARKQTSSRTGIEIIKAAWSWPWLLHGFSARTGGISTAFGRSDLNLGGSQDARENIETNRKLFLRALGSTTRARLVTLKQIHSGTVHIVNDVPEHRLVGDGVITRVPGLLLAVQVADCVPVLVLDPAKRSVGAFHAGWRGTVNRIVEKGVGMMRMAYGSSLADLHAAIGPCIGPCCYRVGREVKDEFISQFDYAQDLFKNVFDDDPVKKKYPLLFLTARAPGHSDIGPQIHLDLVEANRRQLLAAGIKPENIWSSGLCTSCNTDRLFSHRAEHGHTGRMMGVIGVRAL